MAKPGGKRSTFFRSALRLALATGGFAALCTQVLLLRELLVAWRGNEMSLGISLSVWLAATGAGGLLYATLSRRVRPTAGRLGTSLLVLGALGPLALTATRLLRLTLGMPAGELSGLSHLVLAAAVSLAPPALTAGFVFALAISLLARSGRDRVSPIGSAYVLEASGAVGAGALMSYVLLANLTATEIALLTATLCALVATLVVLLGEHPRRGLAVFTTSVAVLSAVLLAAGDRLDDLSVAVQWRELGFRSQANSVYGRVVTTELGSQRSVYESGVLAGTHPDRLGSEQTVHVVMLQHPRPGKVLLVGGCVGGATEEILKHPEVRSVDCVELDPLLVEEARRQFGAEMTRGLTDPRVTLSFGDARFFVKRARESYDVVILAVPDPTTARLNRFYTSEFFSEVEAVLAPGGVVGLTLSSAPNYVSDELAALLACVRHTLELTFANVLLTPGDPCHLLASREDLELSRDSSILSRRIEERKLDVVYVRDYYLEDRLSPARAALFDDALAGVAPKANTDLSPTCYYLSLVLWDRQLYAGRAAIASVGRLVNLRNVSLVALLLAGLALAPALMSGRSPERVAARARLAFRRSVFLSIFVVGLTEISLEMASLLAFQSLYGFVYDRVALLVAAFMGGLAVGGTAGRMLARRMVRARRGAGESPRDDVDPPAGGVRGFVVLQAGIALVPIGLWRAVVAVSALPHERLAHWSNAFPLLVVGSAVLAGIQFPLAAALAGANEEEPGRLGGRLYGADLSGAALGASLTAVFLLPVLGLSGAMTALSILNVGALVALAASAAALTKKAPR